MDWFNSTPRPPEKTVWENIEQRDYKRDTARMSVPGGWIVRERVYKEGLGSNADTCAVSLVFIADEDHRWRLE